MINDTTSTKETSAAKEKTGGWMGRLVRLLVCVWNSPYTNDWRPIHTAPQDGTEIIVYCPPAHGLNHMASVCAWHEDAGFCVCELREPTLWIPLPNKNEH